MFDTEQDLLVCLGVQDPDVTASLQDSVVIQEQ
jgi:hypothetical protein